MAAVIILRAIHNPGTADQWYLTGTGWETTQAAGTSYSSKEAAMVDGETLRESCPYGSQIVIKDLSTSVEYPVPLLIP